MNCTLKLLVATIIVVVTPNTLLAVGGTFPVPLDKESWVLNPLAARQLGSMGMISVTYCLEAATQLAAIIGNLVEQEVRSYRVTVHLNEPSASAEDQRQCYAGEKFACVLIHESVLLHRNLPAYVSCCFSHRHCS